MNRIMIAGIFYAVFAFLPPPTNAQTESNASWKMRSIPVQTRWAKEVSPTNALTAYPRPQMVRKSWQNLNGLWQYAITAKNASTPSKFDGQILVPYPIESALSGVKKMVRPDQSLWYKRTFSAKNEKSKERTLLHFGAVDWQATVFVNGKQVGTHTGGYDNFSIDITDALKSGTNELAVKVVDPTDQGPNPRGKQVLEPKDIWYTPTTGIWQTVWLETVPTNYIKNIKITTDVDKSEVVVTVTSSGAASVTLTSSTSKASGKAGEPIRLKVANPRLWSPEDPYLYDLKITAGSDQVDSYFGMRKVEIKKDAEGHDRIFLNNKPVFNLGVLDQGFWPDGIYTAPTDEALAYDIKAIKSMGFNTIRKHIKREPDRWYYHCDSIGMIVWQDMIQPMFNPSAEAKKVFEAECKEHIEELYNHPSITTYTLFNEKWGQYDQKRLSEWIKGLDPTRLLNGHSGEILYVNEKLRSPSPNAWVSSDITDIHSYPDPMNAPKMDGKARVLGEFGGIGVFIPDHQWNTNSAWGYITVTPAAFKGKYTIMNQHLKLLAKEGLCASIYTQPFDVEGEQNGLMTYDREVVKIPFEDLRTIHSLLIPTVKNFPQVAAANPDLTEPTMAYANAVGQYLNGQKDATFLRRLGMMAGQTNDAAGKNRFSAEYMATLKKPYSDEDLGYILQVTNKTSDAGFALMKESAADINRAVGARAAENKMMNIIYQEVIAPAVSGQNANPDWAQLAATVAPYGAPGDEILLRAKSIHYFNQGDWKNFVETGNDYITKYGSNLDAAEINQFAWAVFERVQEKDLLLKVAEWSKLTFAHSDQPEYMDTYANLLYKAGKTQEAITAQEKAVSLMGDNPDMKETLGKMKRGEPTWK